MQTVSSGADRLKMGASAALLVLALAGYFLLSKQGALVQWAAFVVGLAAAVGVFLTSEPGQQLIAFGIDATRELKKVVWPTRKEATQMTLVVFGFVFIMALFLWLTDKSLEWIFYDLILGWKK
ncbi:MAG: preprotein translocase subunit SecE [Chthoniobacteraceae bacterium]|nr:preprotein translocase subunit SecE [Chthoniobacteraceae bacterium]